MPTGSYQQPLQFQHDHEKTQQLLARYVEIEQTSGGAGSMYPDVAAHLEACLVCRGLYDDLAVLAPPPNEEQPRSYARVIDSLVSGLLARHQPAQPPLGMLFREEVILRVGHLLPPSGGDQEPSADFTIPPTGHLLFYDTLNVGRVDLVAMFTLHQGKRPDLYRVEGVIAPEQPSLRFKAILHDGPAMIEAAVDGERLLFDGVKLGRERGYVTITLEGHARWRSNS